MLAPVGRDADVAVAALTKAGLDTHACASMEELCTLFVDESAGAAVLTQEALRLDAARCLIDALNGQPAWSDFPMVILADGGEESQTGLYILELLGPHANVTLLERPVRSVTLVTAVRVALRARGRQYQVRDELAARERDAVERQALLAIAEEARADAERASRAKDEFLAILSHELRSPLGAIRMWAGLLRGGNLDEKKRARALEAIERNTVTQAQLIEDLLDVSRVIAGKLFVDFRPVDPTQSIEAALDAVRMEAEAKRIRIEQLTDLTGEMVAADPARLQQIVWNLLSNAIKFSPAGSRVVLRVGTRGGRLELVVADEGEGIAPDFAPHIFDRFRQADASSTRQHGGLGLGLAIVRHLVERHGGTISVESAGKDRGATFTVTLPLLDARRDDRLLPVAVSAVRQPGATRPLAGLRIVVVDDEAEVRDAVVSVLVEGGAEVRAAASADEADTLIARELPDVLLSDIAMPGRDGHALIRGLKDRLRRGGVRSAALTAYASADDRRCALAAGFDEYVAKPVDPDRLIEVIATLARAS